MLQTHTIRLKLHDDGTKTLGVSHLTADTVTCEQGLVEGADFEVNRERGTVRRLREFGRELYTFACSYDDLSEQRQAEESSRLADSTTAKQAITNLQAYIDATSVTNAQTVAVVKLLCRAVIIMARRLL
jgi:hypothetical protein